MIRKHHHSRFGRAAALLGTGLLVSVAISSAAIEPAVQEGSPVAADVEAPAIVVRINPGYPRDAAENRIEGQVTASFTVTEDGRVTDIAVLDSSPGDVFDDSAVQALSKWRFRPAMKDGSPVAYSATQTIEFTLD